MMLRRQKKSMKIDFMLFFLVGGFSEIRWFAVPGTTGDASQTTRHPSSWAFHPRFH